MTVFKVGGIVLIILAAASMGRGDVSNLVTAATGPSVMRNWVP